MVAKPIQSVILNHARSNVKLAVVSHILPPSWSAQAVILQRLLRKWAPDEYCLISSENYIGNDPYGNSATDRLPGTYHHLPSEFYLKLFHKSHGLTNAGVRFVDLFLGCFQRARNIATLLKNQRCSAVLGCTGGNGMDIPAAFLAARSLKLPYYVYAFDDYAYQWTNRVSRAFAQIWDGIALKNSRCVIVPNEFLARDYRVRYGIEPRILRHACDSRPHDAKATVRWPTDDREIRIVYTGAVYEANFEAFRNLVAALKMLPIGKCKLYLYTAQPPEVLDRGGIDGPVVYKGHVTNREILEVQAGADILFLPLAFDSPYPKIINTSLPGKMPEYLASGRPILVHAPSDSFLSWYFRSHNCGLVVDEPSPGKLAETILKACSDESLISEVVSKALEAFSSDFNLSEIQRQFREVFGIPRDGGLSPVDLPPT